VKLCVGVGAGTGTTGAVSPQQGAGGVGQQEADRLKGLPQLQPMAPTRASTITDTLKKRNILNL
jgi:hypothetical protein